MSKRLFIDTDEKLILTRPYSSEEELKKLLEEMKQHIPDIFEEGEIVIRDQESSQLSGTVIEFDSDDSCDWGHIHDSWYNLGWFDH